MRKITQVQKAQSDCTGCVQCIQERTKNSALLIQLCRMLSK